MVDGRAGATGALAIRRKRARFRCWHRGTRELDLLLGPFADREIDRLGAAELDELERLLAERYNDLYDWIVGHAAAPAERRSAVLERIRRFHGTA